MALFALVVLSVVPVANAADAGAGGFPLPDPGSWFSAALSWGNLPKEAAGSAAGKSHTATADSTRSGAGNGKPRGKGDGELDPASPLPARKVAAGLSGAARVGFDAKTSKENPAKRTKTSKTYDNADGSTTVDYFTGPVNYAAADGTLQPIDSTLVPASAATGAAKAKAAGSSTAAAGGRLVRAAADATVSFATSGADADLMSVGDGTGSVSFGLQGAAAVTATAAGSQATFSSILPGVDLRLLANGTGVEQTLVLNSASAPTTYVFPYSVSGGLTARMADSGVEFADASGTGGIFIPDAIAIDSAVIPHYGQGAQSNAITYSLTTTSDGRPALEMTLDAAWLHDPSRVFPVLVDPTASPFQSNDTATMDTSNSPMGTTSGDLKIGSYDGSHKGASFIQYLGISSFKNTKITAATVNLWHTYSSSCSASEPINLYGISGNWNVSSISSYPGVSYNSTLLGSLNVTGGGSNCGSNEWDYVPLNASGLQVLQGWAQGTSTNYGFLVEGETSDSSGWKRFNSYAEGGVIIPSLTVTYQQNQSPAVNTQFPNNGASVGTLTPELLATGSDPDRFPNSSLQYDFQVWNSSGTKIADSGLINGGDWTVPSSAGLVWNQSYSWTVQAYDGLSYSPNPVTEYFVTAPPQPPITSLLSQNTSGRGFDAGAGNYTTSATDADIAGVGPTLQVTRDYNSLDPRLAGAFGAAWSSVFDARASEQYLPGGSTVGSLNITYPDGSQTGWGRNSDGSFTSPGGRYAQVKQVTGGYTLTDKNDTVYTFTQSLGGGVYGITSVTDALGRAVTFGWSGGVVTTMTSGSSGRTLTLAWATPSGASAAHVRTVTTDPATAGVPGSALTWTYNYSGDQLSSVCSPVDVGTNCTRYGYTSGSPFASAVMDSAPQSYWRLNELAGPTAGSSVLINEGSDNEVYTGTIPGQPSGLTGTSATSVSFAGGTASYASSNALNLEAAGSYVSVGAWFKTSSADGVIFYYGDQPLSNAGNTGINTPALFVGTDGKLHGCFSTGYCNTTLVTSASTVTDGAWHYALLSGAGNTQTLYLDGVSQGTASGTIQSWNQPYIAIGAGVGGQGWPYLNNGINGFHGSLSDVAVWTRPLTQTQVTSLYQSAKHPTSLLTGITKPSGKTEATVAYNPENGNVEQVTDSEGGVWAVPAVTVTGSSQVYRSSVLAGAPSGYWRLGDPAGSGNATDEVAPDGQNMAYANVTLGQSGPFADAKAATFNGTTSSLSATGPFLDTSKSFSVSAWVDLTDTSATHPVVVQNSNTGGYGFWLGFDHNLNAWALTTANNGSSSATTWYSAAAAAGSTQTGVWTHLVGTYDTTTGKLALYVNGVLQSRQDAWPTSFNVTGPLTIGLQGTSHFTGSMSDVAIYPSALSGAQVSAMWAAYKNSSGIVPATTAKMLTPGAGTVKVNFDGTSWAASAAKSWDLSGARLAFQTDGNLVIYRNYSAAQGTGTAVWASNTWGHTGAVLVAQTDGNLVIYSDSTKTTALWATATNLGAGNYFTFAPDGTFTVFNAGAAPLWNFTSPVTNAAGVVSEVLDPNAGNRQLAVTDADGGTTSYGYDTSGFLYTVTDPDGDTTTTGHDVRGNMVSRTTCQVQSTNTCSTAYYTYWPDDVTVNPAPDPRDDLITSSRDARSANAGDNTYLTTTTYDAYGNQTSVTTPPVAGFPNGRTSTFTYSNASTVAADGGTPPPGLPLTVSTAGGKNTTTAYLHNGDIASTTDAAGLVTSYTYDNLGRTHTKKVVSDTYPSGLTTTYTVDGLDRIVETDAPATTDRVTGAVHTPVTTVQYDADGDVLSTVVSDSTGGDASRTTTNTYDAYDHVATVTDPLLNKTTYGYDAYGNRNKVIDANNVETDFAFDAVGHQLTTTLKNYAGDPTAPAGNLVADSRAYDPAGRLASVTDALGNITKYTYTDNGLTATVTKTDSSGNHPFVEQSNTYDAAGNLISRATNNLTTVTTYQVDAASRVSSQTLDPSGVDRTTSFTYNPDDAVVSTVLRDSTGWNRSETATFDAAGRQTSQTVHAASTSTLPAQTAGLTGSWPLADATSTVAADASGGNHPASALGGASWSTDHGGSAVFDGTGQFYTGGPVVDTSKAYTVSAWVNLADTNGYRVVLSQNNGLWLGYDHNLNAWALTTTNSANPATAWYSAAGTSGSAVTGTWTHLVGIFTGTKLELYVNGVLQSRQDAWPAPFNSGGNLVIGNASFVGKISGVRVYNRALSDPEAKALYAGDPKAVPQNGLAGQWNLTDGNVGTAADASGDNQTGTLAGGVSWSADRGGSAVFDGSTGSIATAANVVDTTKSFSVGAWVKPTAVGTGYQVAVVQQGTNVGGFYLQTNGTVWEFTREDSDVNNSTGQSAVSNANATTAWTHLVGTYNASTGLMTLYVNGVAQTATVVESNAMASTGPLRIGRGFWNGAVGTSFKGEISGVQTYNRVLSASEVSSLYGSGSILPSDTTTTTTWQLDERGLPKSVTDPNGNVTTYTYDEAGRKVVTSAPAVNAETGGGTPVSVHPTTTVGYDTFGEAREMEDADGNTVTTDYDADGHIADTVLPNYTAPGTSTAITAKTTRQYDPVGNLLSVTDPLNHQTAYTYDQRNLLATSTAAGGGVTRTVHDADGEILSVTDGTGAQSQATWDYLGRKSTSTRLERQPSTASYTTTYNYGTNGLLSSTVSPTGVTTTDHYDNAGELTSTTDGAQNTTSYTYDFMGDRNRTTLPDSTSVEVDYNAWQQPVTTVDRDSLGNALTQTSKTYDGVGNVLSSTDGRTDTTTFAYDAAGRLSQEIQPVTATGSITTSFGYDAAGNQTRYTDGNGGNWISTYNVWNLPESSIEPTTAQYTAASDRTNVVAYDADGRAVSQTAPGGVNLASTYDVNGNLTDQSGTGAEAATAARHFTYDNDGRVLSASTTAAGSQAATSDTFTYDDRGFLLSASGSSGSSSFGYNGDGSMTSRIDASGTSNYGYDTAGRVQTINDAASGTTLTYSYNTLDQPSQVAYGTGNVRAFGYDTQHRLTSDALKTSGGTTIASIGYGWDGDNNLTSKTTTGFATSASNTYSYDFANRLTSWNNGTATVAYAYDNNGNRTQVGSSTFQYDSRDQLTSDGTTTYSYTARGTQTVGTGGIAATFDAYGQDVTNSGQTYTYDAAGRMVTDTASGVGSRSFAYSGPGNLIASDGSNLYSRNAAGGLTGIGTVGQSGGSGLTAWTDIHTDVVGDFTTTGTSLTGSAAYDPLGKLLGTRTVAGSLGYQSEFTESGTGDVNMAARWYNPATGQFTSRDTWSNNPVPNSVNANPFAYGNDDPMTATDPTGHRAESWSDVQEDNHLTLGEALIDIFDSTPIGHAIVTTVRKVATVVRVFARVIRTAAPKVYKALQAAATHAKAALKAAYEYAIPPQVRAIASAVVGAVKAVWNDDVSFPAPPPAAAAKPRHYSLVCAARAGCTRVDDTDSPTVPNWLAFGPAIVLGGAAVCIFGGCEVLAGAAGFGAAAELGAAPEEAAAGGGLLAGLGSTLSSVMTSASGAIASLSSTLGGLCIEYQATVCNANTANHLSNDLQDIFEHSGDDSPSENCSFDPATPVLMADGSTKPIGTIKPGDKVESADPDTGKDAGGRTVQHKWVNHDDDLLDVKVVDGKGHSSTLHTTANHPFYDENSKNFVRADHLVPGGHLATTAGNKATVVSVAVTPGAAERDNLTVEQLHTYYVVADGTPVLVHNTQTCEFRKKIAALVDSIASPTPTRAVLADANGDRFGPAFDSGDPKGDSTVAEINARLRAIYGYTDNRGWQVATHAEPKAIYWLNQQKDINFANIVINNTYVCPETGGPGWGCRTIIPDLLQQGKSVDVWFKDSNGVLQNMGVVKGTAPPPSPNP